MLRDRWPRRPLGRWERRRMSVRCASGVIRRLWAKLRPRCHGDRHPQPAGGPGLSAGSLREPPRRIFLSSGGVRQKPARSRRAVAECRGGPTDAPWKRAHSARALSPRCRHPLPDGPTRSGSLRRPPPVGDDGAPLAATRQKRQGKAGPNRRGGGKREKLKARSVGHGGTEGAAKQGRRRHPGAWHLGVRSPENPRFLLVKGSEGEQDRSCALRASLRVFDTLVKEQAS